METARHGYSSRPLGWWCATSPPVCAPPGGLPQPCCIRWPLRSHGRRPRVATHTCQARRQRRTILSSLRAAPPAPGPMPHPCCRSFVNFEEFCLLKDRWESLPEHSSRATIVRSVAESCVRALLARPPPAASPPKAACTPRLGLLAWNAPGWWLLGVAGTFPQDPWHGSGRMAGPSLALRVHVSTDRPRCRFIRPRRRVRARPQVEGRNGG